MIIQHWWNGSDRGQLKHLEKNLPHFDFVHHKSHFDWPGIGKVSLARDGKLTVWAMTWPQKINLNCKIRDLRSNAQYLTGPVRNQGTTSLERFQFGQYDNRLIDCNFFKVCSCILCQHFSKLLPRDISIMRPHFFNSLTRKIDLYVEFVDSLMRVFLNNEECFVRKRILRNFINFNLHQTCRCNMGHMASMGVIKEKIFTKNWKDSDLFEDLCVDRNIMLNFISNK